MTKKELTRVYVIKSLIEDKMTSRDAAEVLSLSERQIKRLKAGVKKEGEVFVIHKNRGRKPKHTIPGKIRDKIVFLALTKYKGANYTHLTELLEEHEGITISQSSVSRVLKAKGIKSSRKHQPPKSHRSRERKSQEGLLLLSVYVDRHIIFKAPSNAKLTLYDELEGKALAYTQFSRAMQELSIGMVYAYSPQAKGRIERLWETLQDR